MRDQLEEVLNSSMNWMMVPDEDPAKIADLKPLNIIDYFNALIHKIEYLTSKFKNMKK